MKGKPPVYMCVNVEQQLSIQYEISAFGAVREARETKYTSFTVSSTVTTFSSYSGMGQA